MSEPRLAVFTYGTLRPGNGNARLWAGRAEARHDGDAFVIGYALVTNGGFPYMVPATMAQTVGALIVPTADDYDDVLADMDYLEGVPSHYERIPVPVHTGDTVVMAWTYVPARIDGYLANLPDVDTNERGQYDWAARTPRRLNLRG